MTRLKITQENIAVNNIVVKMILKPEELFETRRSYLNELKKFDIIEFGTKSYFKDSEKMIFPSLISSTSATSISGSFSTVRMYSIKTLSEFEVNDVTL